MGLRPTVLRKQDEFVRTIAVPGVGVDRPGNCEHLVSSPLAGVIKQIHATPHDRVKPGEPLFTVQIISEPLLNSQAALYKTRRELDLTLTLFHQIEDLVKE